MKQHVLYEITICKNGNYCAEFICTKEFFRNFVRAWKRYEKLHYEKIIDDNKYSLFAEKVE